MAVRYAISLDRDPALARRRHIPRCCELWRTCGSTLGSVTQRSSFSRKSFPHVNRFASLLPPVACHSPFPLLLLALCCSISQAAATILRGVAVNQAEVGADTKGPVLKYCLRRLVRQHPSNSNAHTTGACSTVQEACVRKRLLPQLADRC
jgi:hypothetical protein